MVIYTTSLEELFQKLKTNGVKITVEPVITPGYKFLHCHDLYGNENCCCRNPGVIYGKVVF